MQEMNPNQSMRNRKFSHNLEFKFIQDHLLWFSKKTPADLIRPPKLIAEGLNSQEINKQ